MTILTNATEFFEHLQQSKLLTDAQFDRALEMLGELCESDPMTIAKALVKLRILTRLQAQRLLEGRTRGFYINQYRIDEVLGSGGMGAALAHRGPDDLGVAPLVELGAVLLVSRSGHPFRRRERQQLLALARIADRIGRRPPTG